MSRAYTSHVVKNLIDKIHSLKARKMGKKSVHAAVKIGVDIFAIPVFFKFAQIGLVFLNFSSKEEP